MESTAPISPQQQANKKQLFEQFFLFKRQVKKFCASQSYFVKFITDGPI
jgi:hypothetical protein